MSSSGHTTLWTPATMPLPLYNPLATTIRILLVAAESTALGNHRGVTHLYWSFL
ncbi:hypothetical protein FRAHR75_180003 [Frankia sp. Hr75.2]|nr:hypothetical protein FRAHR75_180003 [Frankia sp. Hr75.2]